MLRGYVSSTLPNVLWQDVLEKQPRCKHICNCKAHIDPQIQGLLRLETMLSPEA
jgi:hypothetical protein